MQRRGASPSPVKSTISRGRVALSLSTSICPGVAPPTDAVQLTPRCRSWPTGSSYGIAGTPESE